MSTPDEAADSDWEYEYDTNQTETIYIPVDLPIIRSPRVKGGSTSADKVTGSGSEGDNDEEAENDDGNRDASRNGRANSNASDDARRSDDSGDGGNGHNGVSDRELLGEDLDDIRASQNKESQPKETLRQQSIQILDLCSDNPMISYRGQVYSCDWGRTIGTDLVFAAPGVLDVSVTPIIREEGYDLISATRVKLVGRPVILEPLERFQAKVAKPQVETATSEPVSASPQPSATLEDSPLVPAIEVEHADRFVPAIAANEAIPDRPADWDSRTDPYMMERNSWLQRFAEIRHQKGEEIKVPVRSGQQIIDFVPKIPGVTVPGVGSTKNDAATTADATAANEEHQMMDIDTEQPDTGSTTNVSTRTPRGNGRGRAARPRARGRATRRSRLRVFMPETATMDTLTGYNEEWDSTDPTSFSVQSIEPDEPIGAHLNAADSDANSSTPIRARGRGRGRPPRRRGQDGDRGRG